MRRVINLNALSLSLFIIFLCASNSPGETPTSLISPATKAEVSTLQKTWAKHLEVEVETVNSLEQKLVLIPPGEFTMGRPGPVVRPTQVNRPEQQVKLTQPFWLGRTEVTQGQWSSLMKSQPWKGQKYVQEGPDFPACFISHNDTLAFISKLNEKEETNLFRLPTEAEWEYACRAGSTTYYYFGDDETQLSQHAWWGGANGEDGNTRQEQFAHRVALKQANPFGLFDMHGNVSEDCSDWYAPYPDPGEHFVDPQGPKSGDQRVSRGGNWIYPAKLNSSTVRHWIVPDFRDLAGGFRLAKSIKLETDR